MLLLLLLLLLMMMMMMMLIMMMMIITHKKNENRDIQKPSTKQYRNGIEVLTNNNLYWISIEEA